MKIKGFEKSEKFPKNKKGIETLRKNEICLTYNSKTFRNFHESIKPDRIMELMEINGNWWKIMELVEIICYYWKSTNKEAKMAKNPKVTHKYFFSFSLTYTNL